MSSHVVELRKKRTSFTILIVVRNIGLTGFPLVTAHFVPGGIVIFALHLPSNVVICFPGIDRKIPCFSQILREKVLLGNIVVVPVPVVSIGSGIASADQ